MDKRKTSTTQKKSSKSTLKMKVSKAPAIVHQAKKMTKEKTSSIKLKKDSGLIDYSPTEELLDENFIALAIWECLKNNDPEGVVEIIGAHLEAVNKTRAAQEAHLPRSSMYNALKGKNPTVKTLAKLVNCCA